MNKISKKKIPEHVALIMDGNGRWAKEKNLDRLEGHKAGVKSVIDIVTTANNMGIKYLTLYAFSTENWNRPQTEVLGLMTLLVKSIQKYTSELIKQKVCLKAIGDTDALPTPTKLALNKIIKLTANHQGVTVILALNYGSRDEITRATKLLAEHCKNGHIHPKDINTEMISANLYTANFPDPELVIRTSGEMRLSNFLLWQLSYAEIFVTEKYWPDFGTAEFTNAIEEFMKRERRYGALNHA